MAHEPLVLDEMLVAWNGCRIRAGLLTRIRDAYAAADPDEVPDLSGALEKALRGMEVLTVEQIPAKLRRRLGL